MPNPRLILALAILVGLALRIPGVFWGQIDRREGVVLEPDEFQHIALASDYVHRWGGEAGQEIPYRFWNTRAYGFQLGSVIFLAEKLGFEVSYLTKHALLGRFLSVFYAILLIVCVFYLGKLLFADAMIGALAAIFFAVFDLHITYSHYALPASAYLFWTHLSLLLLFRYYLHLSGQKTIENFARWEMMLGAALAMTFGLKFDFLPLLLLGIMLILCWRQGFIKLSSVFLRGFRIGVVALLSFPVIHGFAFSWEDLIYSFQVAQSFNENAIPRDNHWVDNPILYLSALIGGTSIWLVGLAFGGMIKMVQQARAWFHSHPTWLLFFLFVSMEFAVRWFLDTPFIRRANVFLPFLAIMAAYYSMRLWRNQSKRSSFAIGLVWFYTLGVSIFGQNNFWQDTRYQALSDLINIPAETKVYYSTYGKIPGMPEANVSAPTDADLVIVHETYYGRYWKYYTTPFKVPACCEEVYNCANEDLCLFYQDLLGGESVFELQDLYETYHPFPERRLFKHFFGTYETFLGDLRIYKRTE